MENEYKEIDPYGEENWNEEIQGDTIVEDKTWQKRVLKFTKKIK